MNVYKFVYFKLETAMEVKMSEGAAKSFLFYLKNIDSVGFHYKIIKFGAFFVQN